MLNKPFDGNNIAVIKESPAVGNDWIAYLIEYPHVSATAETPWKAVEELNIVFELLRKS